MRMGQKWHVDEIQIGNEDRIFSAKPITGSGITSWTAFLPRTTPAENGFGAYLGFGEYFLEQFSRNVMLNGTYIPGSHTLTVLSENSYLGDLDK